MKMLGPLRIPDLADDFVVMDADLRWVRPVALFQFGGATVAVPTMVWTDRVPVSKMSMNGELRELEHVNYCTTYVHCVHGHQGKFDRFREGTWAHQG